MDSASRDVSGDFATGGKIYLNNAAVSPMPVQSIEAMRDFLISYSSMGPDSADSKSFVSEKIRGAREAISKIIGCHTTEIVLTQSTTDGINFVANGLSFPKDSNIIMRGGAHEHHSNFLPWLRLKDKTAINCLAIDDNGLFGFNEFDSFLDKNTRLVVLSHALYNTGAIMPVEDVGRRTGGKTCFFVDSAQTVGCVKVDVSDINCNFMSFNGSKWLCGPMGTGVFYCNKGSSDMLEPESVGGESAMIYDGDKLAWKDIPDKFQAGFRNYVGVVGLEASAAYLSRFGLENIYRKNRLLSSMLRDELSRINGVTLYGPSDPGNRTSIVSFDIGGMDPDAVVKRLEKENIVLAVREILEKKIVRASPHFFNTESEMGRVVDAIKRL